MKQKYPLYRQSLEFYVTLKLLTYFKSLPNKSNFAISNDSYPLLGVLLDSIILTKKSSVHQILSTNTVSARIRTVSGDDFEINNKELLEFESYYEVLEYLKKKFSNQNESSIQKMFILVFSNEIGFIDTLEKNLRRYLVRFVDDQLHQINACKFEYQIEVIRNKTIELSKSLNLNDIKIDSQTTFKDCDCHQHFIEIIGALFLSKAIELHQINFDPETMQYTATIGLESPERIDVNTIRSFFGLAPKTDLEPTFIGDNTYAYENGQLILKLNNGSKVLFDLRTKPAARFLFETMYELRNAAPRDKEYFTNEEIVKKYNSLHRHQDDSDFRTITTGRIGDRKGNCLGQMFKGANKKYRERIEWDRKFIKGKINYTFRIK